MSIQHNNNNNNFDPSAGVQRSPNFFNPGQPPRRQSQNQNPRDQTISNIGQNRLENANIFPHQEETLSQFPEEAPPSTLRDRISNAFTRFRNFFRRNQNTTRANGVQGLRINARDVSNLRTLVFIRHFPNNSAMMTVDINELTNDPKGILVKLNNAAKGGPVPRIVYTDGDETSEGVDAGGLRKDFIARLMKNLFIESDNDSKPKENHLQTEKGFPIALKTETDIQCYNELGSLFAKSLKNNSEEGLFKLGPIFSESFYAILSSRLLQDGKNGDDWFIQSYLDTSIIPSADDRKLILKYLANDEVELSPTAKQIIQNILIVVAEDIPDEQLMVKESRQTVKNAILELAKDSKKLNAVMIIADQIEANTEDKEKLKTLAANPKVLQEEIEGILDPALIIEKINKNWEYTSSVSQVDSDAVKKYLTDWINNADPEKLSNFLQAVTGNRTLAQNEINVKVQDLGKNIIPNSHTCSNDLVLSSKYDQEIFNARLDTFIEESLTKTGFQAT